jgi:hypothetical protein
MPTVDIDNRDPGGTDAVSLVNRLKACTNTQIALNTRLADIQAGWQNPGPPNAPDALNALIAECDKTIQTAQRLLAAR